MNSVLPTQSLFPPNIFEGRLSPNNRCRSPCLKQSTPPTAIYPSGQPQPQQHKHTIANLTTTTTAYSSPAGVNMSALSLQQNSSGSRKRQRDADDDPDRMSQSPSASPSIPNSALPAAAAARRLKKARTNMQGRQLALPRLLETLSADEMRGLLKQICERRPDVGAEVVAMAPRPSVQSALDILRRYEEVLRTSFPVGSQTSEYAYNRVRQPLMDMFEALKDYTPHFLPPNEVQSGVSLSFLDEVTNLLHRLPNWESYHNNRHKAEAYEEMAKAWALVIREAAKKGAGIQLQYQGWDQKLAKHNEASGGKMEEAMQELRTSLGWMGSGPSMAAGQQQGEQNEAQSIRQQLLSGTYGQSVRVGPW